MGNLLAVRRTARSSTAASPTRSAGRVPFGPAGAGGAAARVLKLQRQVGNRAVSALLAADARRPAAATVQRDERSHPENLPLGALAPAGRLSEEQWTAAYRAAEAKPSAAAYGPLFRDIALTAGMGELAPGFVPATVPVSDGRTAQPGLNLTLDRTDEPGHTAWVDPQGAFGVPLRLDRTATPPGIAIILSPQALAADKGLSLTTARHEMVHARHHQKVLAAFAAWRSAPGRTGFDDWLRRRGRPGPGQLSALDLALVGKGAHDGQADTEVLAYVEGFCTEFHRRAATLEAAGPAFFQLLGAVESSKLYTWAQASSTVQAEALTRLKEYRATLDADHQRVWKEWRARQLAAATHDKTGRRDFLVALGAFVV